LWGRWGKPMRWWVGGGYDRERWGCEIEQWWRDLALKPNIKPCSLNIGSVSRQLVVWMGEASEMKAGWWIRPWEVGM
jgi:hypothetical protein